MRPARVFLCCAALLLAAPHAPEETRAQQPQPAAVVKHGGKIETKYDGFAYETVVALRKMNVTCGEARGFKDIGRGTCVSLAASLHLPGQQLDFVRRARLQLIFEAADWDRRHPPGARALTVVADTETYAFGQMSLVSNDVGTGLLDDKSREVLEVSVPFETFQRIARASTVELRVGRDSFALRDKNLAALRDLMTRVKPAAVGGER